MRRRNQRDPDQLSDDENTSVEPSAGRKKGSKSRKGSSYYNSSAGEDAGRSIAGSSRGGRSDRGSRGSSSSSKSRSGSGGLLACLMCKRNKSKGDDESDDERHEMRSLDGSRNRDGSGRSRSMRDRSVRDGSLRDSRARDAGESLDIYAKTERLMRPNRLKDDQGTIAIALKEC